MGQHLIMMLGVHISEGWGSAQVRKREETIGEYRGFVQIILKMLRVETASESFLGSVRESASASLGQPRKQAFVTVANENIKVGASP